jgi:ankyrin repeat protein
MIQKFMKSLHDQEKLNIILSACDLFDLNIAPNAKKYTARICNGDYVHIKFASPLSQVAYDHKEIDIAQLLLENGADINKPDLQGAFPLDYAIHTDNKKMIKFLISNGGKCSLSCSIEKLKSAQIIPTVILPTSRLKSHAE